MSLKSIAFKSYRSKCCFILQIDNVGNPSWQAQIKGTKKWTLEPPPECAHVCDPKIEVTVNSGEISMLFVLVNIIEYYSIIE